MQLQRASKERLMFDPSNILLLLISAEEPRSLPARSISDNLEDRVE